MEKKRRAIRIPMNIIIPLAILIVLFLFFAIYSGGKSLNGANFLALIDQATLTLLAACGTVFIVAQGGTDLSIGTTLAFSSVLAGVVYTATGGDVWLIPIVVGVFLVMGLLNGFLVTVCKVPSFMTTISMLIGVRGLVNYLIDKFGVAYASSTVRFLNNYYVKIPVLILFLVLAIYIMEYTKMGRYSKAIGENEMVAISIGVPVRKIKIIAFMMSAFTACIAGVFMTAKLSGTNFTMGSMFEMQIIQATFLGGVLVTGGNTTKIPKVIIGALTLAVIENGLVLCGWTSTDIKQIVEGLILMLVLFISIRFSDKVIEIGGDKHAKKKLAEEAAE